MTTAASLCTGYLGLDLAAEAVLGPLEHAWISEIDKDALTVLAARLPGVRNLGDLTRVAWSTVEPVDVLTAGYPCQPFSQAGKRKGEHDDRHLWPYICDAVSALRPGLVLLENVAGHLSLGGPAVIASLAALRYDARWLVVRAADVGACHRRARWFCVAADINGGGFDRWADLRANTNSAGFGVEQRVESGLGSWRDVDGLRTVDTSAHADGARSAQGQDARTSGGNAAADGGGRVESERDHPRNVPDADRIGRERTVAESRRHDGGSGREVVADSRCERHGRGQDDRRVGRLDRPNAGTDEQRQRSRQESFHRDATPAADSDNSGRRPRTGLRADEPRGERRRRPADDAGAFDFGPYAGAIARHAAVLGRAAPSPVDEKGRLSPRFSEWMMMLPDGWVSDLLGRTAALRVIGNGVVPPQAAYAYSLALGLVA